MNNDYWPDIGEKIQIGKLDSLGVEEEKYLDSQVLDIIDDHQMFIAAPIINNMVVPIAVGQIIQIKHTKKNSGIYYFNAKVVGRKQVEHIAYIKIERIGEIQKAQRRDFFRLEVVLDVTIILFQPEGSNSQMISALSKDISGGGIRVISNVKIPLNTKAKVSINTGNEKIEVDGNVVRSVSFDEDNYEIGILFEDISEVLRTKIISFIFSRQRKMRKKGLI